MLNGRTTKHLQPCLKQVIPQTLSANNCQQSDSKHPMVQPIVKTPVLFFVGASVLPSNTGIHPFPCSTEMPLLLAKLISHTHIHAEHLLLLHLCKLHGLSGMFSETQRCVSEENYEVLLLRYYLVTLASMLNHRLLRPPKKTCHYLLTVASVAYTGALRHCF